MNLEPFFKSSSLWIDLSPRVRAEMLREAGNVEDIALAILKANRERKESTKPSIMDGLGAQMHTLIRELTLYRNTYDMKIVDLRVKGEDSKFAHVWCDLYSYIINQIIDIEPNVRVEIQIYERFVHGQRAMAQRRS